jgi:plasmid stabilization system protein ParE
MPNFELSYLADCDIAEIIGYTIEKWDIDQAIRYVGILDAHFEAIGKGNARAKAVFIEPICVCPVAMCEPCPIPLYK